MGHLLILYKLWVILVGWIGKDDFGNFYYHVGNGAGSERTMRIYPNLDLGVVVMSNVRDYQRDRIVEGLVSAWMHEK